MTAKTLMVVGTMSSAGKSTLVTALCRIFSRRGVKVAPFKAQNMSNNAAVCADGGEIGRAQYTQAQAAGVAPTVQMNPVLLKPEADMRSQVIVNGRVWQTLQARNYYERKQILWGYVTTALDQLQEEYDLIIMEGAGSPVELNLKPNDIVNMAVAKYMQAPTLLAGDIDRGGVFAQLLGTLDLLDTEERALVQGLVVNKFRGDPTLFEDGITILEERSGVPVLGVVPYVFNHGIPEEDGVPIEEQNWQAPSQDVIDVALIALPRISNFDDFDPLKAEHGVSLRYVSRPEQLGTPDAIIIPGTKSTLNDLNWLHTTGLARKITELAPSTAIVGICGGYQMLGTHVYDPDGIESTLPDVVGLRLLEGKTTFLSEKVTQQTQATIISNMGWLADINNQQISGYEIHMGQTHQSSAWLTLSDTDRVDGDISADGRIWGCYIHGLFANINLRRAWLKSLGWQETSTLPPTLDMAFDNLADIFEANLDMGMLEEIIGL